MNDVEKARKVLFNKSEITIMNAFNIIGFKYLQNENVFYNDKEGFYDLCERYEIFNIDEVINLLFKNDDYNTNDEYIFSDGKYLISSNSLDYCYKMLYDKMNNEVAIEILNND